MAKWQLDMFRNVRRDDPETSWDAAMSMQTAAQRNKAIVYRTLERFGPMTPEEISTHCELDHSQVWRRVSDLLNDGAIYDTGERRKQSSGRMARVMGVKVIRHPNHA